jgi:hypothetical protein
MTKKSFSQSALNFSPSENIKFSNLLPVVLQKLHNLNVSTDNESFSGVAEVA